MEHKFSIGKFPPGKRDYLFRNFVYSGNFPVGRTKKSCSIYIPTEISVIFLVNGSRSQSLFARPPVPLSRGSGHESGVNRPRSIHQF